MSYTYKNTAEGREIYKNESLLGVVEAPIKNPDPRIIDMIMQDAGFKNEKRSALVVCFGGLDRKDEESREKEEMGEE